MHITTDKLTLAAKTGVKFEPTESIKWVGKPNLRSYLLNVIRASIMGLRYFAVGIIVLCFMAFLYKADIPWDVPLSFIGVIAAFFIIQSVWNFLKYRTTIYVITDLSIVIHCPFISRTKVIHLKDIRTKELKRTCIDKRLNTGTISFYSGDTRENEGFTEKVYDHLNSIEGPGFVYSII
ncbi:MULTISPECIES: PH domain-containing protein [Niastella]|uniref:PH domain-containing protein n=1 Tax=Niastella soli TaxID=2821487 RepID=A0ABS3Z5J9_9BACT|nr:PH domain-containing protein [Niastella soli]MBO9205414.1 PH domain-containing protein [Niastella soli]